MVDANTNGVSDVWENIFLVTVPDPAADLDGDGQDNLQESVAGTDPLDETSIFRLQLVVNPEELVLRWPTVAGRRYQIQSAESPVAGPWETQPAIIEGTGGEVLGAAAKAASNGARFYRLRIVPDGAGSLPRAPAVSNYDIDNDGNYDFDEHFAGTDPLNPGSNLRITRAELGKVINLQWRGVAGKTYVVEGSTNATGGLWREEGDLIRGSTGPISVRLFPRDQRQFYRVRVSDADSDDDGVTDWEECIVGTDWGPFHYRTNYPTSLEAISKLLNASNIIHVEVGRPTANATRLTPASICVLRTGNLAPLRIHYSTSGAAVSGTDYEPLSGVVELPAGARAVDIPIIPLAEAELSPAKALGFKLLPGTGYAVGTNDGAEVNLVREVALSVSEYGAVGDGIVDDTAAIQSAIAALEASTNYNTLHFPTGTYRLNSPTSDSNPNIVWNQLLRLGTADLAGRDLFFTGAPGATLYSTLSDVRANIIAARARFRSLTFRGLNWAKVPEMLPGTLSEQASGVFVVNQDYRRVEAVEFFDCTFDNCHGAVETAAWGYDLRGRLARFGFYRCGVTNQFGPNTTNVTLGSGQQIRLNPWVGQAIYADNYFDGGSDTPDLRYNPTRRMKDGSHFGSPLQLIFTNNVVRHMEAEAVHQNDDPYIATTAVTFVIPPPGGPTAQSAIFPTASTFKPGQLLNFRLWFHAGAVPTNVLLHVVDYDSTNRIITVTNSGLTPGVAGQTAPTYNSIYLAEFNPTEALIAGNLIENGLYTGLSAITANAKATLRGNTIIGFEHGVLTYEPLRNPVHPPTRGLVIDSNVIITRNSLLWPNYAIGILTYGPEDIVVNNLILSPNSFRFAGVRCRGSNSWVEGNTILARTVTHYGYDSPVRAVGIGFGYGTVGGCAVANRTRGFDVGVGPEGSYQVNPHRVITHTSQDDVLPIDPIGLVP